MLLKLKYWSIIDVQLDPSIKNGRKKKAKMCMLDAEEGLRLNAFSFHDLGIVK